MADYETIRYEVRDGVARLTLDRPERLNAFRGLTLGELLHAFKRAWADAEVACVILTGAGERAFCVGGDQKEYVEKGSYGTSANGLFEIDTLHNVIRDTPKPVILDCRVEKAENCFPMIPSGAAHYEMLLGPGDKATKPISEEGMVLV